MSQIPLCMFYLDLRTFQSISKFILDLDYQGPQLPHEQQFLHSHFSHRQFIPRKPIFSQYDPMSYSFILEHSTFHVLEADFSPLYGMHESKHQLPLIH